MNRLMSRFQLARSLRTSGVTSVVAPRNPRGRIGSALAVTSVLVGVQLGLLAGHASSSLCRLVGGGCSPPERVAGGQVLENPTTGVRPTGPSAVRTGRASTTPSRAHSPSSLQTVALRVPHPAASVQRLVIQPVTPGFSAAPTKRQTAKGGATSKHAAKHHGRKPALAAHVAKTRPHATHDRRK